MKKLFLLALAALLSAAAATSEQRRDYLKKLNAILPPSAPWEQWLARTGELPPDFDALPAQGFLPDPLVDDGRAIRTEAQWRERRLNIRQLFEQYVIGTMPPRPKNLRAVPLGTERQDRAEIRRLRLEFGPDHRGKIRVDLLVPDGKGPFPVLLGPAGIRAWAQIAVRRGYLCALYAGSDFMDDADALAEVYPDYEFALLARRAWAGQRVLDYLEKVPEADLTRVGITGHSRDGKQALISAAFDERIRAVVASSTGAGGMLPYRLTGEKYAGEGIEWLTRVYPKWFHPRLRFFAGREQHLPVDGNLLVALVAPRSCLLAAALNDWVDSAWGVEQTYLSAQKVYGLLGQPDRLGLRWRFNLHSTYARDIEDYLDWFDIQFGRSRRQWSSELLYAYDFETWRKQSGETVDLKLYPPQPPDALETIRSRSAWEKKAAEIRRQVEWMLGERPPAVTLGRTMLQNSRPTVLDDLPSIAIQMGAHFGWRKPESEGVAIRGVPFGDNLRGDLYYEEKAPAGKRLPVVLWLHGYSYPMGYQWSYRNDLNPILALVRGGYAVFAFDMHGFGTRILEAARFYDRYPRWSQLGRMIDDARAAIDALGRIDRLDPARIYVFGYSIGATVGVYTAALDARVKGLVSICGFTPMRIDTAAKGTEGVARYSHIRGLLPRLGFFVGAEQRIPYDFDELLASIAPRPVLVMAPQLDRDATFADVQAAIERARGIYRLQDAAGGLELYAPWDYNRLPDAHQQRIIEWMQARFN